MKRLVIAALLAFAVSTVVATAAPGSDATKNANAACTALKAKIGATAFTQAYATFGRCVSSMAPVEQQNLTSADASCTAEQNDATFAASHGGKTFDQFYGTGKNSRNAFGNCVSAKAKASSKAEGQDRPNPARTCRAERTLMGVAPFGALYGKNANDRNAFDKCVAKAARAQTQNELNATAACRAEQGDATFVAASSTGRTPTSRMHSANASRRRPARRGSRSSRRRSRRPRPAGASGPRVRLRSARSTARSVTACR